MDAALRDELLAMVERGRLAFDEVEALSRTDSSFADELTERGRGGVPLVLLEWPDAPPAFRAMVALDRDNTQRFSDIVDTHGWPGVRLVGIDGEEAAWEIAMHADTAQGERRQWLSLIDDAVRRGDVPPKHAEYIRLRTEAVQRLT